MDKILRDPYFRRVPSWTRTPRAVARILHGVASPAFLREEWSQRDVWARHKDLEFGEICEIAKSAFEV